MSSVMSSTIIIMNPTSEQLDDKQFAESETMIALMSSVMSSTTINVNPTSEKLDGKL